MVYNINFLPAKYGDSIWIEYGENDALHNILIDGGTKGTRHNIKACIDKIAATEKKIELIVVTHIDRDHIEGILGLLEEDELGFETGDLWFNGWKHLSDDGTIEPFGALQGERLTGRIKAHGLVWNEHYFKGGPVVIPESNELPVINLPGGMKITLLSPRIEHLQELKKDWKKEVEAANLEPGFGEEEAGDEDIEHLGLPTPNIESLCVGEFHEDDSAANGSSIAFLAEYGGKSVLFAGDSFPGVVLDSLTKLYGNNKVPVDLVKLSHHASAHNTSPELIKKLQCKKYVISTNGSIFKHPAEVTVARVIKFGGNPELIFNYTTNYTSVWDSELLKLQYQYKTQYPGTEGIAVALA